MSSSISPPAAPAPGPIIVNEEEMEGFPEYVDDMLKEHEEIQQALQQEKIEVQQIRQTLEQKETQLTSYFSTYFRTIISCKRGYDFQNSKFDYLVVDKYLEGGDVMAFARDGTRIRHTIKEEKNDLTHNCEGLISMNIKTMRFGITLGPMPIFDNNKTQVIFGEIETGMKIIQAINARGIQHDGTGVRRAIEAYVVDDDSHADAPLDIVSIGDARPGATTIDSSHAGTGDVGGQPIDNIVIYTCGQRN
ncbi:unnamed protein product [Rotaria sp. Silwood2]|nr:unnamed protein product [Rotaria sp. Silwood2]CAF2856866.1 unnamed protein product [Rotaria sp. Silwood2]CAF3219528.1 unnamed protein product [Rotaria sp. Silwood2]